MWPTWWLLQANKRRTHTRMNYFRSLGANRGAWAKMLDSDIGKLNTASPPMLACAMRPRCLWARTASHMRAELWTLNSNMQVWYILGYDTALSPARRAWLPPARRARLPLAVRFRLLEERFRFLGRRLHSSGINDKRALQFMSSQSY